jgi:hypothetical protein
MRIVIIRPGALGDTLMLAPALAGMKGRGDIVLIARTPGLDILRPLIKEGMDYERGGWHRLFMDHPFPIQNRMSDGSTIPSPLTGEEQGEGGTIDLAVAFLSDPSEKVRENLKALMPGSSIHVFPPFPRKGENVHTALYLAKCMESSGCAVNPAKAIEEARQRPLMRGGPFSVPGSERKIVIHPGSGGAAKNHPREFWAALLHGFRGTTSGKAPLAVLLGPAEESCVSFYRGLLRGHEGEIVFSPEMKPLLRLLKNAPLYVGHDSGITHLAAMLGIPTIALFRNSSIEQWEPLGPRVKVIEGESRPDLIEEVYERAREMIP